MRAAMRGLTTRGRSFLAAAAAAALSALVLGEADLLRVAALLAALPLAAAAALALTRYRLSCTRLVQPDRVPAGSPAQVSLRLENLSRLPSGVMLLEEQLPYALGGRPRFVLDRLRGRQTSTVAYAIRADTRGRYDLGPLAVRLTDPFGLCALTRSFTSTEKLVVTPAGSKLPAVRLAAERIGSGESRARSVAVHGEDDAATREYRHGDDLRKVHWRSTARVGELMVRREEQPWHATATVLLDTRMGAHRGEGPTSSFEWAVAAAASIALHLGRSGYDLRLVTDAGTDVDVSSAGGEGALLDVLSEVRASGNASLATAVELVGRDTDGLVIAVVGMVESEEYERLAALRARGGTAVVVLVDTAGWVGLPATQRAAADARYDEVARRLGLAGWRILRARHGSRIDVLWPAAARPGTRADPPPARGRAFSAGPPPVRPASRAPEQGAVR